MQNDNNAPANVWVMVGTHVEVELIDGAGESERMSFDIVPDAQADLAAGFMGLGTPLAQALHGRHAGDMVPYNQADIRGVHVLSVAPSQRRPDPGAAAARRAATQEAVQRSDLEDQVRLALTVNVKWGDYDPEGIVPDEE